MSGPSARRRHRAGVVTRLASRAAGDDDAARLGALSWRALGELPDWCALDESERRELRELAGAVSLAPAVRRCVSGETLLALRSRIGEERLRALRSRPYGIDDDGASLAAPDRLDVQLGERGSLALSATVDEPIARALSLDAPFPAAGSDMASEDAPDEPAAASGTASATMSGTLGRLAVDVARELLATSAEPDGGGRSDA